MFARIFGTCARPWSVDDDTADLVVFGVIGAIRTARGQQLPN
jgi:hypothetical protein